MSTRSVIAKPDGTGWKGRYVHFDGYPSHMLTEIQRLVQEKGVERVIDVVIHWNPAWSSINDHPSNSLGKRAHCVSNYGVAYTDTVIPEMSTPDHEYRQASFDDWITSENAKDSWCEWAYVLGPESVTIYELTLDGPVLHAVVGYNDSVLFDEDGGVDVNVPAEPALVPITVFVPREAAPLLDGLTLTTV